MGLLKVEAAYNQNLRMAGCGAESPELMLCEAVTDRAIWHAENLATGRPDRLTIMREEFAETACEWRGGPGHPLPGT